jgi:hypothetical protein
MNFTLFITLIIVTTIFTTFVGRNPTTARSAVMQAALLAVLTGTAILSWL